MRLRFYLSCSSICFAALTACGGGDENSEEPNSSAGGSGATLTGGASGVGGGVEPAAGGGVSTGGGVSATGGVSSGGSGVGGSASGGSAAGGTGVGGTGVGGTGVGGSASGGSGAGGSGGGGTASGWLYTEGNAIKLDDGDGNMGNDVTMILHGVSMIDITTVSTDGGYQAQLDRIATWNVNVVRMPVYMDNNTHGDTKPLPGGWTQANADTLFSTYLDPAVQYAKSLGMYVIVDLHYITDVSAGDQFDTGAKNFWTDMAPRYANDPQVLYEIFNEPINTGGDQNWSSWRPIAQAYVDIIRAAAPNNLVLVGAPRWSQIVGDCASDPITGGNIVYVGHIYGWHYDGADGPAFSSAVPNCAASHPMFFTEWGADSNSNANADTIKNLIKDNGISFTAWAFHNQWGPSLFSGGTDDDPASWSLTTYGTDVKAFLDTY